MRSKTAKSLSKITLDQVNPCFVPYLATLHEDVALESLEAQIELTELKLDELTMLRDELQRHIVIDGKKSK